MTHHGLSMGLTGKTIAVIAVVAFVAGGILCWHRHTNSQLRCVESCYFASIAGGKATALSSGSSAECFDGISLVRFTNEAGPWTVVFTDESSDGSRTLAYGSRGADPVILTFKEGGAWDLIEYMLNTCGRVNGSSESGIVSNGAGSM